MPAKHSKLPHLLVKREKLILDLCRGKRVLHLGCTSSPNLDWNMRRGTLLHVALSEICECVGCDIDKASLLQLSTQYGIHNAIWGDAEHLENLDAGTFDVVVAGELIEHLNNPGNFLKSCKSVLRPDGVLVITTVNAFCLRRFLRVPFGVESVHPDHVCYYSHSTLRCLVERFGYRQLNAYSHAAFDQNSIFAASVERMAGFVSPNLCEGIAHTYTPLP